MNHTLTAEIAYRLFEHRGRVHGRHVDDWFLAERILTAAAAVLRPAAPPAPAPEAKPATKTRATKKIKKKKARSKAGRGKPATRAQEERAKAVLAEAVEAQGRAAVAAALGYSTTGTVSAVLRGDRLLSEDLARRIVEAFAPPADGDQPGLRVVA